MKVTIKPKRGSTLKQVFRDGVLHAEFHFSRFVVRSTRATPGRIYKSGQVIYPDGRKLDLGCYAWAADIARDFRNGTL